MGKFNSPLPQPLPQECLKAAKIFRSFVDGGNNGLDGVVPRDILANAKGLAIFSVVKAGFVFSARAGTGIVLAKLDNGAWSAPSAIGTAGLGIGGQLGAEVTDFLIVLNSRSAVVSRLDLPFAPSHLCPTEIIHGSGFINPRRQYDAIGPIGRNGEALGSVNSSGRVAAMYSYSKTRGLFGGLSIEGSVIVERQDANSIAYHEDYTAKRLLSGSVPVPEWAQPLIRTLESCTGLPGNRKWVQEGMESRKEGGYAFGTGSPGAISSPREEQPPTSRKIRKEKRPSFPPAHWSEQSQSTDFASQLDRPAPPRAASSYFTGARSTTTARDPVTSGFDTPFESDFHATQETQPPRNRISYIAPNTVDPFEELGEIQPTGSHSRSLSLMNQRATPMSHTRSFSHSPVTNKFPPMSSPNLYTSPSTNTYSPVSPNFSGFDAVDANPYQSTMATGSIRAAGAYQSSMPTGATCGGNSVSGTPKPYIAPKPELAKPLERGEVARAIALFDYSAAEAGDLSFAKGAVIAITQKSQSTDDWWRGKADGREGIFPANFVEVV